MSVAVEPSGAGLAFGIPARLFDSYAPAANLGHSVPIMHYAVTSDGKRFLVARPLGTRENDATATPLTVILNWPAAVNAR